MLVTRRAFNFDGVVRLLGLSEARRAFEPSGTALSFKTTAAYEVALDALDDREVEALMLLQARAMGGAYERAMRKLAKQLRRRTFRRAVANGSSADRRNTGRLKDWLADHLGGTRPVEARSPLCAALGRAGVTPTDIVELLDRLGVERMGVSREGARALVKERIARQNARQ
jgi:hypothetical protein